MPTLRTGSLAPSAPGVERARLRVALGEGRELVLVALEAPARVELHIYQPAQVRKVGPAHYVAETPAPDYCLAIPAHRVTEVLSALGRCAWAVGARR